MEEIVEILGEKKFSGSTNTDLKMRVSFYGDNKVLLDNNIFYNIDSYQQYNKEKNGCTKYRIYGKINPIINTNVGGVDKKNLEFNSNNWILVLLKSNQTTDLGGFNKKGVKTILRKSGTESLFSLELGMGLPAKYYFQTKGNPNTCLLFPYGHNFNVNDSVMITDTTTKIPNGLYTITDVSHNKIFLNILSPLLEPDSPTRDVEISGLLVRRSDVKQITRETTNTTNLIIPEVYVKKVKSNEILEYYMKTLEVISVFSSIDDCAFSHNHYGNSVKSFTFNNDINIGDLIDNINLPLDTLYLGIIKKTNTRELSQLESNFANTAEYTAPNSGLEAIRTNKIKVGDLFYHSLCEFSTENLEETEIMPVKHNFVNRNVIFSYSPFYKIPTRYRSTYIEESEQVNDIPRYAIKSKLRDKYIWRNYYDIGVFDEEGGGLDYPYINDSLYAFKDVTFFVTTNKRRTPKIMLHKNDINGNIEYNNEHYDLIKDFVYVENVTEVVPYNKFIDKKC